MSSVSLPSSMSRSEASYVFLASLFVGVLVLTNIIGTKLFLLSHGSVWESFWGGSIVLTTGILTYPFTFLLTDIVSEIWGKSRADFMAVIAFSCSILMFLVLSLGKNLPPAPSWQVQKDKAAFFHPDRQIKNQEGEILGADAQAAQAAFSFTFDAPWILLCASMTAFMVSQLLDNYMFHFWRRLTKGRFLWLRNNASTFVSQLVDTIIVNGIFLHFYWNLPWFSSDGSTSIIQIMITVYICKCALALADTPLIYAGVAFLRRFLSSSTAKSISD